MAAAAWLGPDPTLRPDKLLDTPGSRDAYVRQCRRNKILPNKTAFFKYLQSKFPHDNIKENKDILSKVMLSYWKVTKEPKRQSAFVQENIANVNATNERDIPKIPTTGNFKPIDTPTPTNEIVLPRKRNLKSEFLLCL